jgi:hypothetical protein
VKSKSWESPAFQQWTKEVAAMPAEKQVEAVSKKLMELNPGFDGLVNKMIEGNIVTGVSLLTDNVKDISPIRVFTQLQMFECSGSFVPRNGMGKITDLSPLKGMQLTRLVFHNTQMVDLSPLENMPLSELICSYTQVSDLAPLKSTRLKLLDIKQTNVSDLSPLKGLKLEILECTSTKVRDLSPLENMPLKFLELGWTEVSDLTPLKGMPLADLRCHYTNVKDLSPVANSRLTNLWSNNTQVSDLSPLKGLNLTGLTVTPKNITKGMDVIRTMKSLPNIGLDGIAYPTDEFWRLYDAGEFGKPTP